MSVTILGIESSCDDTSSAVIRDGVLLSNVIASQAVHEAYGGVVPELASRAHQQNIIPVVAEAIKRAGINKKELSAIAFTRGPGLMGSLLVGTSFAKGLSASLNIPMIEINHLQAHVLAHFIKETPEDLAIKKEVLQKIVDAVYEIDKNDSDKKYLAIYDLRFEKGMTQKEIAEELNLSQSEVSKRLFKLMEKVKQAFN